MLERCYTAERHDLCLSNRSPEAPLTPAPPSWLMGVWLITVLVPHTQTVVVFSGGFSCSRRQQHDHLFITRNAHVCLWTFLLCSSPSAAEYTSHRHEPWRKYAEGSCSSWDRLMWGSLGRSLRENKSLISVCCMQGNFLPSLLKNRNKNK